LLPVRAYGLFSRPAAFTHILVGSKLADQCGG
jgi:hypothetical protein